MLRQNQSGGTAERLASHRDVFIQTVHLRKAASKQSFISFFQCNIQALHMTTYVSYVADGYKFGIKNIVVQQSVCLYSWQ